MTGARQIGHKYELYVQACRRRNRSVVAVAAMWSVMQPHGPAASAEVARTREIVRYDNVEIDLIAEGRGPLIVMLPSARPRLRGFRRRRVPAHKLAIACCGRSRVAPAGARARSKASGCRISRAMSRMSSPANAGPAVIAGRAFGNWVARMTAADHPALVRGVVLMAAAAKGRTRKNCAPSCSKPPIRDCRTTSASRPCAGLSFQPRRATCGCTAGRRPQTRRRAWRYPRRNRLNTGRPARFQCSIWFPKGTRSSRGKWNESRREFGDRVSVVVIPNASHALIPEQPGAVVDAVVAWIAKL